MNYKDAGRLENVIPRSNRHQASHKHATLDWVLDQLVAAYVRASKQSEAIRVVTERLNEIRGILKQDSPELGRLLAATGKSLLAIDPAAAEPVLRECLTLRDKLSTNSPDIPALRNDLVKSHLNLGLVLARLDRCPEAELELRAAQMKSANLVADFPGQPEYEEILAVAHHRLAFLLGDVGKYDEVREQLLQEIAGRERSVEGSPEEPTSRVSLGVELCDLATTTPELSNGASLPWLDKSIEVLKPVVEAEPQLVDATIAVQCAL